MKNDPLDAIFAKKPFLTMAKFVPNWNIVKTKNGTIGVVRNDSRPANRKGVIIQLHDKTAVEISGGEEVEYLCSSYELIYEKLKELAETDA